MSLESSDEVVQKLLKMQKEKQGSGAGGQKERMPYYLRDSLPDARMMPAKSLVANIPENMDRPPVDILDRMVS